jgi:cytochrome c-type biogenesis protein CcmH/NrfG
LRTSFGSTALGAALVLAAFVVSSCAVSPAGEGPSSPVAAEPEMSPEEQMASARAALAENEGDSAAWFRLGAAWQRQGAADPENHAAADSAIAAFEQALVADPDNVPAMVHLGLALEDRHRFEDALAQYDRAIEAAPEDPLPLVNKSSLLYFQFKKTYEAKQAISRALELDPNNADAHFNLGVMFADANLFGEARTEWEKVLETAPDGPARSLAEENLERIQPMLEAAGLAAGTPDASGE